MNKRIKLEDLVIHYRFRGSGRPLILLHGWNKSARIFVNLQNRLAKDFAVYALDLPGFGNSSFPQSVWGVPDYARLVTKFADSLKIAQFSLIGHSFGGRIALELAAKYPGRIDKLVLTGVPVLRKKLLFRLIYGLVAKTAKLIFFIPPFIFFQNLFKKILYRLVGEVDYLQTDKQKRKIFKKVIAYNQVKLLNKITSPALLVWGENDRVTPLKNANLMLKCFQRAQLKIIPLSGHKLPYEKPEDFYRTVNSFLK